jgi:hypothetical protein
MRLVELLAALLGLLEDVEVVAEEVGAGPASAGAIAIDSINRPFSQVVRWYILCGGKFGKEDGIAVTSRVAHLYNFG